MHTIESHINRFNVLGVGVHALSMGVAVQQIQRAIEKQLKGYICVTGVHGVMEAQGDPEFKRILNSSFLNTPDGMPMVWVGKLMGQKVSRVYGPDLMLEVCKMSVQKNYTHFFYGGKPGVVGALRDRLVALFPGLKVVGAYTPPFRPLNNDEEVQLSQHINLLKPDIFWVGLSTPKQEKFSAHYLPRLNTRIMIGVGAAFDLHTGRMKDAPEWVKSIGMQWLHRLIQEPRRLATRYLRNNPKFLYKISLQLLKEIFERTIRKSRGHA